MKVTSAAFCIFFFSWVVVYKSGVNLLSIQSEDTLPAMFLPVTVIKEGTFYADTYYEMIRNRYPHPDDKSFEKGLTPFYWRLVFRNELRFDRWGDGHYRLYPHYVSAFPIMSGVFALPVYLLPVIAGMEITFENITVLAHIASALIVSISGGFIYLLLNQYLLVDEKKSTLLTTIYLFASVNYAMISQALWQHGVVELFTILALIFLYRKNWGLTGFVLGFAIISRPTSLIVAFFLGLLVILRSSSGGKIIYKAFVKYCLGFVPALLFFLWYNAKYYVDISNQGYSDQLGNSWLSRFPEGFLGLWLSPSKGILVYSPVFIFSLVGFWLAVRKGNWRQNAEYVMYFSIVFLHTMVFGRWKHWYGGWSFGYRMASDVIPFLVLLMIPFIKSEYFERFKKFFYTSIVYSVTIQLFGIVFFDGIWHAAYDRGFVDTGWLWSIKDSEFVFNIRRALVKLGVIERACPKCLPGS